MKTCVYFVIGPPCSGKGTVCKFLSEKFEFCHLSAGDLLRQEVLTGSELGQSIATLMTTGGIVSSEVTVALLQKAIGQSGSERKFVIDGFPRNQSNLDTWNQSMGPTTDLQGVLLLTCSQQECINRMLNRCKDGHRTDDRVDILRSRLEQHYESVGPIMEHFKQLKKLHHVDASSSIENVSQQAEEIVLKTQAPARA